MKLLKSFGIALMLLFVFSIAESCKKEAIQTQQLTEVEADENILLDEWENPDSELEDEVVYDPEASTKVLEIKSQSGDTATANADLNGCTDYRYKGLIRAETGELTLTVKLSQKDTLLTCVSAKPEIIITPNSLTRVDSVTYTVDYTAFSDSMKTKSVRLNFTTQKGKTIGKSEKFVGFNDGGKAYGTSVWGVGLERKRLNQTTPYGSFTAIDTSYTPQITDVLSFNSNDKKLAVIVNTPVLAPATNTKPAKWKFKIVEWNGKNCRATRGTKSITVSRPLMTSGIMSVDATTAALKYAR
jgi:hypothetical protein